MKNILAVLSILIPVTLACSLQSVVPPATSVAGTVDEIFVLTSIGSAYNGATTSTTFITTQSWQVTEIKTYHWNEGNGVMPGTIGLVAADGTSYGPWQTNGLPGSGDVPNAYWVANPNIAIPAGIYSIIDSDPATWAQNSETGGAGMAWVSGVPQGNP